MAKQDFETLIVALEANLKSYEKELAKAQGITVRSLRKIEGDMQSSANRVEKTFSSLAKGVAGFAKGFAIGAVISAVAGIEEIARGSIVAAANIGDLSDKLGITSDKLQELQFGAVQANMSFEELETGLLKFSKALGQARNGQGDLLKTLRANGFSDAQIKALSYSEALDKVAELVKNAANEQDAFLIITQAFGKGSDEFLEFLKNGSGGLKQFASQAHDSGTVIDQELIQSAQRFDDAWARALLHVKSGVGSFVLGVINDFEKVDTAISGIANRREAILRGGTRFGNGAAPSPSNVGNSPSELFGFPKNIIKGPETKLFNPEQEAAAAAIRKERERDLKRQKEAVEKVIEALKLEGETLGKSNLQQEIATALSRADVTAKSAQGQEIIKLVTANEMQKASLVSVQFAAEEAGKRQEEFAQSLLDLSQQGVDAFSAWAIEGEKLGDTIINLAKSLLQASVSASLFGEGPLAGLFGTGGGAGGFLTNLFKKPGLYAGGGKIGAGELGIAGEGGHPELIMGPANVIPFNKLGGRSQQTIIVDQRTNAPAIQQQTGSDGTMRFFVRDGAVGAIGDGSADRAMRARFGLTPLAGRRG